MATTLIFVLLLCTFTQWTDGSKISFHAYPSTLKANVTDAASMRCELEDTELTRKIVTNTTHDVQHVTSISVTYNDGKDVAHASAFDVPVAFIDVGNLEVKGDVTGTSSEGYLQLTWKTPALMSVGQYTCTIDTIDGNRHRTTFEATLELSRVEPTLHDLVVLFQQQHLKLSNFQQELTILEQENAVQTQMIDDLKQKDLIKSQVLANQSSEINQLKQCTSPSIGFMAVMTAYKHLSTNTMVTYDKLITDTDGSYDLKTGKFTCKEPGTYLFNLNAVIPSDNYACIWLFLNSDKITTAAAAASQHGGYWFGSGSASAVLQLKQNDVVYVKTAGCSAGADFYHDISLYQSNSFAGQLLHADACSP